MLKRILAFTVFIMLLSTVVYADDWKAVVDPNDGSVFAVGKNCESQQGDVFITVLYPGADTDNLSADLNTISYLKALKTDAYGNFELHYTLSDVQSGVYPVSINDGCNFDGHKSSFQVSTKDEANAALSSLNGLLRETGKSVSDYETFIDANQSVFGIHLDDEYASCDRDKLWEIMKTGVPYQTNTEVFKKFYSILGIMSMNTDSEAEIADALGEYILLAEPETQSAMQDMDANALKRLYSKMKNKKFDSSTFEQALKEMLIVEIMNSAGRNTIKDKVDQYASEIGLDIRAGSDFSKLKDQSKVYVDLANRTNFNSYSDIKKAFDALVSQYLKNEANATAGNTGGGSGSSGSSRPQVEIVRNPDKDNSGGNSSESNLSPFTDLGEAEWAKDSITYLYSKGIINGVNATEFKPNNLVTREEFVKMLVLALGVFDETVTCDFSDVDDSAWYAPYVASGVKSGIVMGIGDGKFGVGNYITRQDMAVMIYRIIQKTEPNIDRSSALEYSDSELFAPYATEAIETLSSMGIVNGVGDGNFAPQGYLTRAMAAVVIARVIGR